MAGVKQEQEAQERAERVVRAWIEAFNARDIDGILALFDPEIEFRPLRLPGVARVYRRHAGIRQWFDVIVAAGHPHCIDVDAFKRAGPDQLVAAGSVRHSESGSLSPFTGLYTVDGDLIVDAVHYFTPPDVLERLGIIEGAAS